MNRLRGNHLLEVNRSNLNGESLYLSFKLDNNLKFNNIYSRKELMYQRFYIDSP